MASRKKTLVATVMAASVASLPYTLARHAMADDYSDLLDVLRAKGSLTQHEYSTLLSKHVRHTAAEQDAAPVQPAPRLRMPMPDSRLPAMRQLTASAMGMSPASGLRGLPKSPHPPALKMPPPVRKPAPVLPSRHWTP